MNDGFSAPFHRGIIDPILTAGIPRTLAFVLWTTGAAVCFGLQEIWVLPMFLVFHMIFAQLARYDPYFFDVFRLSLKAPRTLDP